MLQFDTGKMVIVPTRVGSPDSQFFQSQGSVIVTKSCGRRAFERRIVPRPEIIGAKMRGMEARYDDFHSAIQTFLIAANPEMYVNEPITELDRAGGSFQTDALVLHPMEDFEGAAYRIAEAMDATTTPNARTLLPTHVDDCDDKLGVYYHQDLMSVRNPGESIIRWRLMFEIADRLFANGSRYGNLTAQIARELFVMVRQKVYNIEATDVASSSELQVLTGLNAVIRGARRLPIVKEALMESPTWRFFEAGGPAGTPAARDALFGADTARYIEACMDRIRNMIVMWGTTARPVANTIQDPELSAAIGMPRTSDLWSPGAATMELAKLVSGLEIFFTALPAVGKIKVPNGAQVRDYERTLQHLKTLKVLINGIPELGYMSWAYDTDLIRIRSSFSSWTFVPVSHRVKYGIVDPLAELGEYMTRTGLNATAGGRLAGMELLREMVLFAYEPVDITNRARPSDWYFDVPLDHTAIELPIVYWSTDQDAWDRFAEWCGNQTSRVLRPTMVPAGLEFPGMTDVRSIFPVYPAILEGSPQATGINVENLVRVDKEHTPYEVDGQLTLPPSTAAARLGLGLDLFQMPDFNAVHVVNRDDPVRAPMNWNPST